MTLYTAMYGQSRALLPPDFPEETFCRHCDAETVSAEEQAIGLCTDCQARTERNGFTVAELLFALDKDIQAAAAAHAQVKADVTLPEAVVGVYRRKEKQLRTARDVVRFYQEAEEEAATIDTDEPIPFFVTPAALAFVEEHAQAA